MTTETILTDDDIKRIDRSLPHNYLLTEFARAIEQAVLQSTQVQQWKRDVERLDFLIADECQVQAFTTSDGTRHRVYWPDLDEAQSEWFANWRSAIDAAMQEQKP